MVTERIERIGELVTGLDGMLHSHDLNDIRLAYAEISKMVKSDSHRISSSVSAAVTMLDGFAHCGAYDHSTGEYLDNLAEEFHSLVGTD